MIYLETLLSDIGFHFYSFSSVSGDKQDMKKDYRIKNTSINIKTLLEQRNGGMKYRIDDLFSKRLPSDIPSEQIPSEN